MEYYTEAVNQSTADGLKKKGIKNVKSTINSLNQKSSIIDLSTIEYKSDAAYMNRLISMCKKVAGYEKKVIYIPVSKWYRKEQNAIEKTKTPLGAICRYIKQSPLDFKEKFNNFIFIFYNENKSSFALYPEAYKATEFDSFTNLISVLIAPNDIVDPTKPSQKFPVKDVRDKAFDADSQLYDKKKELVDTVAAAADNATSEEEAWDTLDDDSNLKELLAQIEEEDDGRPKFNSTRTTRIAKLNNEFLEKEVNGKSIKEIIEAPAKEELPPAHLKVSSINEEWDEVKFTNFQNIYNINTDIFNILKSFSEKSYPVSVLDVKVEDTSTNMDYIDTYTVSMEDGFGKRFTLVFDIPKFKNNRFMRLRGNEKVMSGQLLLLPCLKTDEDTVQCVSNYNKIFIRRRGVQGKSVAAVDKILKALRKIDNKDGIRSFTGDNSTICSKHELPIDYIDLASELNRIETRENVYIFNQDDYFTIYGARIEKGIPYAVSKIDGSIKYYKDNKRMISEVIADELKESSDAFAELYNAASPARLNYSEASILANKIPLIVLMGYSLGLTKLKDNYLPNAKFEDKKKDPNTYINIKFSDGYLTCPISYSSSLLLSGLSVCPTELYSILDVDKRSMWLDFLDDFGGRILSDGLDNFVDLFIDPITEEVCEHCKIPSDYFGMLMYANNLLADNKYNRHTDISGNRYRTNEIVAGYFYKAIAKSYVDYKTQIKRGRKVGMTMKRSAVIDGIFTDPMSSDLSILNPLLEIEASNTVSFKGLSGMNSDRSYGLDKRTYDDSMVNKLALSTGFAANVGINRQTTIDMDVEGKRGYIKQNNRSEDMSVTKSFGMTEAITPFGTTHDDPFRTAMTFVQTSKHSMRTKKASPLLITNGADEAMAHIASDTFAYKAKADGEVTELNEEAMLVTYKTPIFKEDNTTYTTEIINLKEEVKKNSDGGFYITLKLDTDLKVGSKFKKGDIIAYDKTSFSDALGESDNLAYNLGVLAKVAIMNTDEGFEDSTSVSNWLSESMATDIVIEDDRDLSKNTNVYNIVKVGQEVQEGDPLIIFQNSFDEKDANVLLKNITDTEFVSDLGRIRLKSKYTGVIQDIKIYRTCEIEEMSESLQKIVKEYEGKISKKRKMYQKYKAPGENTLDPDYKMPPTGIMKNNTDGVKIVFYIKYNDKFSVGDKCVAQSANKGVVKSIFPEGLEPFSEYRPNENIHALYAVASFNARMVTSPWISGGINKCLIELDRQVKDIMGIDHIPIEEV